LTFGEDIIAYLYLETEDQGYVVESVFISVYPRKRPSNYIYTREMFVRAINGTVISDNKGFAEMFEWRDGNIFNEDRVGYFVNIDSQTTISKSTSINNVYGVTVSSPGFASNCTEDKLNRIGNLLSKYAYVCSFGFASVIDDGTCSVGDVCVPNDSGIATKSDNSVGFKVIDRIDDNHIYVFVDTSIGVVNDHVKNTANPHSVTKSQVGLSNVPNVSTNNQTPTYTEASTLAKLTSGEKLSVAFGKISKSITDLIAHIGNKNNPHGVTKSQVELGNVDNTSDANKPISTATKAALDNKVDKTNFDSLKKTVDGLVADSTFIMTDQTTNKKYTLGMDNGKLVIIPIVES
jgi:hypothetical protein